MLLLPFGLSIANKGVKQALLDDEHLRAGLNVHSGKVTCPRSSSRLRL